MNKFTDIIAGVIVVAGIMVMVRRGSQGPQLVAQTTSGFSNIIKAATGGGSF